MEPIFCPVLGAVLNFAFFIDLTRVNCLGGYNGSDVQISAFGGLFSYLS